MRGKKPVQPCWCGGESGFAKCCEPHILGVTSAPTAEELMRSRYSAYVLKNEQYLLATWHPQTRPVSVEFDDQQHWLGLKILQSQGGGRADLEGTVMFVARYKIAGRGHRLQESSNFVQVDGRWFYLTGDVVVNT